MTNNEKLNSITGETDTPEISAVKMLLARIEEDAEHGIYDGVIFAWQPLPEPYKEE